MPAAERIALGTVPRQAPPPPPARPFRVEAWVEGPVARALVLAKGPAAVVALALAHDAEANLWSEGRGVVEARDLHAPREAVAAALDWRPASRAVATRFGLNAGFAEMARFIHGIVAGDLGGRPATALAPLSSSLGSARPDRAAALGYEGLLSTFTDAGFPACRVGRRRDDAAGAELHLLPPEAALDERLGRHVLRDEAVGAILAPLRDLLRGRLDPGVAALVPGRHWSPAAEAFYAAPGEAGRRRRQAAGLYPILAPMFAHVPGIAGLIDAGRPYEAEALRELADALPPGPAPHPGLIRRLRTLPGDLSWGTLVETLALARTLPLDWLPSTPLGWSRFVEVDRGLGRYADGLGLSLPDLLRDAHRWWTAPAEGDGFAPAAWLDDLDHARDMARRAAQTLVEPLLGLPSGANTVRIAGRLLFGGLPSGGVVARSRSWHEDLPRFDRIVPGAGGGPRWPAAFDPFVAGNGLAVEVLETPDALADEGSRYRDRTGARGLDHCVSGYARDCYLGRTHIASIRRRREGGYERLSTVEFEAAAGGLRVRQHRGRRNAAPPERAVAALDDLLAAIERGRVALRPEALAARAPEPRDGIDRTTPGALADALRAWAPHLPRSAPRRDPGALRAWILSRSGATPS